MLNISQKSVTPYIDREKYPALNGIESRKSNRVVLSLLGMVFLIAFILLLLPWTQNIRSQGQVTTLKPGQRPQTIHSVIAGRIERWYVQEGDYVQQGDTIMYISEVKDEYFDPQLLGRTESQMQAKEQSVSSYREKVKALDAQIEALENMQTLKRTQATNKVEQARLKMVSDSIDFEAARINESIALKQYDRIRQLEEQGLKSKTELENRKLRLQKAQAGAVAAENKWLTSSNEWVNSQVELNAVNTQYQKDIAKAQSDKYTAMSNQFDAEASVTKLQNQYANYSVRTGLYYITAPQDGYVTQTIQSGIGETLKEGEAILSIMPAKYDLSVAMYIDPIDLPLLDKGQEVRIQFDGWPAIVFSGWPNTSYGTYGGEVFAIDNFISDNGKYRILVKPDPKDHPWPDALRVGSGTTNMVLLKDVPIWYELWRNINGFPPDYYKQNPSKDAVHITGK
ncbi:HlyD family efflux transporter periplasmic adaptor subunit [bacterium SCSIO 12741]|nr:HlyD family efflux transporter periplasmic adaptor subunit [bacterium SCSIO 12741]